MNYTQANYTQAIKLNSLRQTADRQLWFGLSHETDALKLDDSLLGSRSLRLQEHFLSLQSKLGAMAKKANIFAMFFIVLSSPVE